VATLSRRFWRGRSDRSILHAHGAHTNAQISVRAASDPGRRRCTSRVANGNNNSAGRDNSAVVDKRQSSAGASRAELTDSARHTRAHLFAQSIEFGPKTEFEVLFSRLGFVLWLRCRHDDGPAAAAAWPPVGRSEPTRLERRRGERPNNLVRVCGAPLTCPVADTRRHTHTRAHNTRACAPPLACQARACKQLQAAARWPNPARRRRIIQVGRAHRWHPLERASPAAASSRRPRVPRSLVILMSETLLPPDRPSGGARNNVHAVRRAAHLAHLFTITAGRQRPATELARLQFATDSTRRPHGTAEDKASPRRQPLEWPPLAATAPVLPGPATRCWRLHRPVIGPRQPRRARWPAGRQYCAPDFAYKYV
jgi:hypothetical protein